MTVSEQEVKTQLAEARQALTAAQESRRRGGLVRLVGTIAGILIVVLFVWLYVNLFMSLLSRENVQKFKDAVDVQVRPEQLAKSITEAAIGTMPEIQRHTTEMLRDLREDPDTEKAVAELKAWWDEELRPMLLDKLKNDLLPQVEQNFRAQQDPLVQDIRTLAMRKFEEHILQESGHHRGDLKEGTELTEGQLEELEQVLREAGTEAAEKLVVEGTRDLHHTFEKMKEDWEKIVVMGKEEQEDRKNLRGGMLLLRLAAMELVESIDEDSLYEEP